MIKFFKDAFDRLRFNRPQRILRRVTTCKTVWDIRRVVPNITTQVRNQSQFKPGTWMPMDLYITSKFNVFKDMSVGELNVLFSELPSIVPEHERFANIYFLHEHCIYDSGLVACVFDGDKNPTILVRSEVIYTADDSSKGQSAGPNLCGETESPHGARIYDLHSGG